MVVDRAGFWLLAAREGKSGDNATFNHPRPILHERANNNHPWPLLAKEGSFVPNLFLFRRVLLSAECSNVLIQTTPGPSLNKEGSFETTLGLILSRKGVCLRNLRVEKYLG